MKNITTAKASDHVKPCNIAQSENHNRRDTDYIKSLNPARLYIRVDLSGNNTSYVPPEMKGVSLQQHYDRIREMVKLKTGRAMQEKDVEYTDRKGKVRVRKGCSPIRESVVNIREDTSLDDLLRYTRKVESRWGIRAIQIHLHKDEGHYENPEDMESWKPNYHAHIIWDWMDHETGKSRKLDANDMSEMQDMVAETLDMERGMRKSETGLDHLERNDFIIRKQEKERQRMEAEKKQALEEKENAQSRLNELEAHEESRSNYLKTLEKSIASKKEKVKAIHADLTEAQRQLFNMDGIHDMKDYALYASSVVLMATNSAFSYCIRAIIDFAYSGTGCRGGNHGSFFWDEESYTIKNFMIKAAEILKTTTLEPIANWLVNVANMVGHFNTFEFSRARKEVNDVAAGDYDGRIQRFDRHNGRGR